MRILRGTRPGRRARSWTSGRTTLRGAHTSSRYWRQSTRTSWRRSCRTKCRTSGQGTTCGSRWTTGRRGQARRLGSGGISASPRCPCVTDPRLGLYAPAEVAKVLVIGRRNRGPRSSFQCLRAHGDEVWYEHYPLYCPEVKKIEVVGLMPNCSTKVWVRRRRIARNGSTLPVWERGVSCRARRASCTTCGRGMRRRPRWGWRARPIRSRHRSCAWWRNGARRAEAGRRAGLRAGAGLWAAAGLWGGAQRLDSAPASCCFASTACRRRSSEPFMETPRLARQCAAALLPAALNRNYHSSRHL